uniref:Protein-lysine N-methyltransferase SMYD4 n=1 Tax=Sphenodon punctatus TaxID=8508 RepID=A0A8D0GPQ5_SPHPU
MDLPVEKWKAHVSQKWTQLKPSFKEKLSLTLSLRDIFLLFFFLRPEDEDYLHRLSKNCFGKDPSAALFYKEEGNKRFQEKEFAGAAILYSKAVSHAALGSPDMSVCYANRSAALFHLGQFEVCLEDISRAQAQGYPERLQPKILLRKIECLLLLGRSQEAGGAISELESKVITDKSLADLPQQALLRKISQLKVKAYEEVTGQPPGPAVANEAQEDVERWEENSSIPNASSAVSLSFDLQRGRHLVASKDIQPGETLVREEAFVSVLCPGENLSRQAGVETTCGTEVTNGDLSCHHCLKPLLASVPCHRCSSAKYCSQECAQQAWECYHRTECSLGGLLLTLGVFGHVALRAVVVAGFAEVRSLVNSSREDNQEHDVAEIRGRHLATAAGTEEKPETAKPLIPSCDVDGKYRGSYHAVFNLLPHTERHSPEHKFLCSLSVAALCKRLAETGLEAASWGEALCKPEAAVAEAAELSPALKVLGEAMLRHVLQLQCNAQAVTAIRESGSGKSIVAHSEQVRLATALFPVTSLLNHSCEPNTSVTFHGTTATVRASLPIHKGQEILHCYGPHQCRMAVAERRQRLRAQYFFECRCQACLDDLGPNVKSAVSSKGMFHCPDCQAPMQGGDMLRCTRGACKALVSRDDFLRRLQTLQSQVRTALGLLKTDKPERAAELLLKCRLDAKSFLSPEHVVVGEIEDDLAQAYATLGKWQEAAGHLRSSLRVVEARHGPSSMELGHELFKLAQILFNGLAVSEALRTIQRAEKVLSVHCGPWSAQVRELQEMKACLLELPGCPVGPGLCR